MRIVLLGKVLSNNIKRTHGSKYFNRLLPNSTFSTMSNSVKIGTHDGQFHCDEALACFLLKLLPRYKDATIVRSRDTKILDTCDVVIDTGNKYDPSTHRYDHHMRDFKETFNTVVKRLQYTSEIKLSSAGLIYCHFGLEIIKEMVPEVTDEASINRIFLKVYDTLIKEIDAIDNGIMICDGEPRFNIVTSLSSRVSRLNPPWNSKNDNIEEQFVKAVNMCGEEFISAVQFAARNWLPARKIVEEAVAKRFEVDPSGEIVELVQFVPWIHHLFDIEKEQNVKSQIKYAIWADKTYRVRAVPITPESFVCRLFLPESWRGLRDDELVKVCGIDGAIFVHPTGFIGGNKTREGILSMARKALKIGKSI